MKRSSKVRRYAATFVVCLTLLGIQARSIAQVQRSDLRGIDKAADWPWWRGPSVDGATAAQNIPTSWNADQNVLWKADVPGKGHSSPIVVGERVFLTSAVDEGQIQSLLCYDLQTGRPIWNTELHSGQFAKVHRDNTQASATPASDGLRIYTAFGNRDGVQLSAIDMQGKIVWSRKTGDYPSEHGFCSSVCLYENLVYVAGEALGTGFIAAFDGETGDEVWRRPRTPDAKHANYATPVVVQLAGRPQLIHAGWHVVSSYDPRSGELLWENPGPADVNANCIAIEDPYLIVSGGYPQKGIFCIKADEMEGKYGRKVVWETHSNVAWVPTPLIHDGRVLILSDKGVLSDLDLKTGKSHWTERLSGSAYASPIRVGDVFMATTRDGTTTVFQSTDAFVKLAENNLDGAGNATPVAVNGKLLIRTDNALYCIGAEE